MLVLPAIRIKPSPLVYNRSTPASINYKPLHCRSTAFHEVSLVTSLRNLGISNVSDLVMRTHVQRTVSGCFAALRQRTVREIRNSVPSANFTVIGGRSGDIQTRLLKRCADRSFDTPHSPSSRLLLVQNAASRLIFKLRRFDPFTDALASLHGLHVPELVVYKIAVRMFKVLHGIAPEYLGPVVLSAWSTRSLFCWH